MLAKRVAFSPDDIPRIRLPEVAAGTPAKRDLARGDDVPGWPSAYYKTLRIETPLLSLPPGASGPQSLGKLHRMLADEKGDVRRIPRYCDESIR
jgi:hypothetical protein